MSHSHGRQAHETSSTRNSSITNGNIYPSKHLKVYRQTLEPNVLDMLKSIEIKNGMILIQSFIEDGIFSFYEIAFRLNGTMEYKIIDKLNGINPLEMMINHCVNRLYV